MANPEARDLSNYDRAAPRWGDKMRTLGYCDGYRGFLSASPEGVGRDVAVMDVGAGSASFSEAWIDVQGPPLALTLLEPSAAMLKRGQEAMRARGVEPVLLQVLLGESRPDPVDVVLAAHVIEHCPDPLRALLQMKDLLRPGGHLYLVVSKPHWCNAIIWLQWRHRTFREEEICRLVVDAGFQIERLHEFPAGPPSRTSRGILVRRPQ